MSLVIAITATSTAENGMLNAKLIYPGSGSPWRRVPILRPFALCDFSSTPGAGEEFIGDQQELFLIEEQPGEEAPYERLLRDVMKGNGALFTREDAVEAAWAVVEPALKSHHRSIPYKRGSWGPKAADALIATDGGWHNPLPDQASK